MESPINPSSSHAYGGTGVGATPEAWGEFTSLLRQAQDGEPVEPLEGEHAIGVTAS